MTMYGRAPSVPKSRMSMMFGCPMAAAARASRWKRSTEEGFSATAGCSSLIATNRRKTWSAAL